MVYRRQDQIEGGRVVCKVALFEGEKSVTAPVVLGPNGAAYVGIRTGVVMAKDR